MQNPRRMTMQQVAEKLGMSRLTVSSVVNGRARERGISTATEERVRQYLRDIGYVPSRQARELRSGQRSAAGLLYGGFLYSHVIQAFNWMVDSLVHGGEPLEIMAIGRNETEHGLQELIARGVSRLIWIHTVSRTPEVTYDIRHLKAYLKRFDRVVAYNFLFGNNPWEKIYRDVGIDMVGVERKSGYRALADLLKGLGHTHVILPEGNPDRRLNTESERIESLEQGGLDVVLRACPVHYNWTPEFAKALVDNIVEVRKEQPVTAALFGDDEIAAYAMVELLNRGYRIPEDISVIGFNGIGLSCAVTVPLTTLRIPARDMVSWAIEQVHSDAGRQSRRFKLELIERQSHGPAPDRIRQP